MTSLARGAAHVRAARPGGLRRAGAAEPALRHPGRRPAGARARSGWSPHSARTRLAIFVMYGQTEATARMAYLPPELAGGHPGPSASRSRAALRPRAGAGGPDRRARLHRPERHARVRRDPADLALGARSASCHRRPRAAHARRPLPDRGPRGPVPQVSGCGSTSTGSSGCLPTGIQAGCSGTDEAVVVAVRGDSAAGGRPGAGPARPARGQRPRRTGSTRSRGWPPGRSTTRPSSGSAPAADGAAPGRFGDAQVYAAVLGHQRHPRRRVVHRPRRRLAHLRPGVARAGTAARPPARGLAEHDRGRAGTPPARDRPGCRWWRRASCCARSPSPSWWARTSSCSRCSAARTCC